MAEALRGCREQVSTLLPRHVASLMWSLAKLERPPGIELARALCRHAAAASRDFGPRELCTVLWSLATLGLYPGAEWMRTWTEAYLPGLLLVDDSISAASDVGIGTQRECRFSPRDLSQTMWALAKLRHRPGAAWASAAAARARAMAPRMSARDLSNLLWAFATLELDPGLDWLAAMLVPLAVPGDGDGESSSSDALEADTAKAGDFSSGGDRPAFVKGSHCKISARDASEIIWSIGRMGHRVSPRILQLLLWRIAGSPWVSSSRRQGFGPTLSTAVHSERRELGVQDVANVCWSLARLGGSRCAAFL